MGPALRRDDERWGGMTRREAVDGLTNPRALSSYAFDRPLDREPPVDAVFLRGVIAGGLVHETAVVPDHHASDVFPILRLSYYRKQFGK